MLEGWICILRYLYEYILPFDIEGKLIIGLEFGVECFCGNWIERGRKIDEEKCRTHSCSYGMEKCGGFESIAVYTTGMISQLSFTHFANH